MKALAWYSLASATLYGDVACLVLQMSGCKLLWLWNDTLQYTAARHGLHLEALFYCEYVEK